MSLLDALWDYQQADAQIDRIEAEIQGTEDYKRYAKLHKFIAQQRRVLARMGKALETKKAQVETGKKHAEILQERYADGFAKFQRIDSDNIKEVERFRQYFEQLNAKLNQEKREFSAVVDSLGKDEEALEEMRVKLARANKEYEEAKAAVAQITSTHKDEIDSAKKEAEQLKKKVDPALIERYDQIKKSQPFPVANVIEERCGGCNMGLPAVTLGKLKEGDAVVECENCGRMLRKED